MIMYVSQKLFGKWLSEGVLHKYENEVIYRYMGPLNLNEVENDHKDNKDIISHEYPVNLGTFGRGNQVYLHILQFSEEGENDVKYQLEFKDFEKELTVETISKYTAKKSLEVGKPLVYLRSLWCNKS